MRANECEIEKEHRGGRLGKAWRAEGRQGESGQIDGGTAQRKRAESSPGTVGEGEKSRKQALTNT